MRDGVYHITISSGDASVEAVVAVTENRFNGGDATYIFQGRFRLGENGLTGSVVVKKWNESASPVLGLFKEVSVPVSGRYDPEAGAFDFKGTLYGHHLIRIAATGRYLAPLA